MFNNLARFEIASLYLNFNIMKTLLISFLTSPLLTLNTISAKATSIEVLAGNGCTVSVDCDGDGEADYSMPVDCEFEDDLRDQFKDSCE